MATIKKFVLKSFLQVVEFDTEVANRGVYRDICELGYLAQHCLAFLFRRNAHLWLCFSCTGGSRRATS